MGLNKKELDKVVAFVKAVKELPGNEEFIANLRGVLGLPQNEKERASIPAKAEKIDAIEKYLGLDYSLDDATTTLDYAFISDERVRLQLESDCREMMRYRYGTRGHKVDFLEFCRYVQLQSEMLLNYYYDIRFDGNNESILLHLQDLNKERNFTINAVTYGVMLYGFGAEHGMNTVFLDYVREVRNAQSHRSIDNISYDELYNKAKKFIDKYSGNHRVNFYNMKNDIGGLKIFMEEELEGKFKKEMGIDKKTFNNQMRVIYFLENTPYNEIINCLENLATKISDFV